MPILNVLLYFSKERYGARIEYFIVGCSLSKLNFFFGCSFLFSEHEKYTALRTNWYFVFRANGLKGFGAAPKGRQAGVGFSFVCEERCDEIQVETNAPNSTEHR